MRNIGLHGGSSLFELGPIADVQLFFDCIASYVVTAKSSNDWLVLTDRLYRRYLRMEELPSAQAAMDRVNEIFSKIPTSAVDWGNIAASSSVTRLDPNRRVLAEIFSKYFEAFSHCKKSAEIFSDTFKMCEPVKIVVSDIPTFFKDKSRALEEYDALVGEPFWKR